MELDDCEDRVCGGRWDVREGKIIRQTELLRDSSEELEERSSDDDLWDEKTYQR